MESLRGSAVVASLAQRFPQLYIAPAEGVDEAYRMAAARGIAPEGASLAHFATSEEDELRVVDTPAGPVEVVFLKDRRDFECLLCILGHRCQPVPIDPTVGAITYLGLADWQKVVSAHATYVQGGGDDWPHEFSRLAKDPAAFRSQIIVISEGPYSNVAYDQTPYQRDEWLRVSREIRLHHECAHVVCRRLMPDVVAPVWDEVTADMVGLLCATGHFDAALEARFLGIDATGYRGGRLLGYLTDEQRERVDEVSAEVYEALLALERIGASREHDDAFDLLIELKKSPLIGF